MATGGNTTAKPFVPAKFNLPALNDYSENYDLWTMALTLVLQNRRL